MIPHRPEGLAEVDMRSDHTGSRVGCGLFSMILCDSDSARHSTEALQYVTLAKYQHIAKAANRSQHREPEPPG